MKNAVAVTKESSINDIVDSLGIERIGKSPGEVFWKFGRKTISRPGFKSCWRIVKREFGIDSDLLKIEGYYKKL